MNNHEDLRNSDRRNNAGQNKHLGMNRAISRRDFLNGVALTIGSTLLPPAALAFDESPYAPEKSPGYYPPATRKIPATIPQR